MNNRARKRLGGSQRNRRSGTRGAKRVDLDKVFEQGLSLHRNGDFKQASVAYNKILASHPDHADSLHLRGVLFTQEGDFEQACQYIERAIAIDPSSPVYHFNLGLSLQQGGELEDAKAAYETALKINPNYHQALENLGVCLQDLGNYQAAESAYIAALKIAPNLVLANQNLGTLRFAKNELGTANSNFEAVLAHNLVNAEVRFKRSLLLLSQGRYEQGWQEYEWRLHTESFLRTNPPKCAAIPTWDGSPLIGTTLLIRAEQGIGEEIQFASCYAEIIKQCKKCIIECDPRLVSLLRRSFPAAEVIEYAQEQYFDADWQVLAGSLPKYLRRSADSFPRERRYINADQMAGDKRRQSLRRFNHSLNVGISWRGGGDVRAANLRSIDLSAFAALFAQERAQFINLQYGEHSVEISELEKAFPGRLISFEDIDPLQNLDEFAALVSALDLVITIDNATAHFAGALGVPTWVLLPHSADWRWRSELHTCPWYPSVRLFKQKDPCKNNWAAMFNQVSEELAQFKLVEMPAVAFTESVEAETRSPINLPTQSTLVLNDTTNWYHWGCSCTSIALKQRLNEHGSGVCSQPIQNTHRLEYLPTCVEDLDSKQNYQLFARNNPKLVQKIEDSDHIIINGEGTIHGNSPAAMSLLYTAYIAAKRYAKPVSIINHSCFPSIGQGNMKRSSAARLTDVYRTVYSSLEYVAVREECSQQALKEIGISSVLAFDCLPMFVEENYQTKIKTESVPYILISGSVAWGIKEVEALSGSISLLASNGIPVKVLIGAGANMAVDDLKFAAALHNLCGKYFELVYAHSELEWLRVIDEASMLVSGRFHHSIAAAFLNTPFVVTSSNTPKIEGVLKLLSLDKPLDPAQEGFQRNLIDKMDEYINNPASGRLSVAKRAEILRLCANNFQE